MKLVRLNPEDYVTKDVPAVLLHAVEILNQAIAISPRAVTEALGHGDYILNPEEARKILEHPNLIAGDFGKMVDGKYEYTSGIAILSGLGILNTIVMTPRFRLFIETEDDNYTYKLAGIFEDLEAET
jgi:hypothetical protein